MFAGIRLQQFPEVRTASTEHDFVCGERALVTGQCYVNKVLLLAQVTERGEDRGLEVVPLQRVLLIGRRWRHRWLHFVAGVAAVMLLMLVMLLLVVVVVVQESSRSPVRRAAVVVVVTVLLLCRRRCRGMKQS